MMASWLISVAEMHVHDVTASSASIGSGVVSILFRWMHIATAALAIGGLFFMRIILPAGLSVLDEAKREEVFLRCRRVFKMLIHTCILLLIVSGTYNSIRNFPQYKLDPPLLHGLWGLHILLALVIFGISLWMLMGKKAPAGHSRWGMVNVILLLLIVAVGSTLKWARETTNAAKASPPATAPSK
jgi:uncharacterized membrane protein